MQSDGVVSVDCMTKPTVDEVEAMAVELIKEAAEYDDSYMAEIAIAAAAMLRC
jgi:hypothetical protein